MMFEAITPQQALLFSNALGLVVALAAVFVLARFLWRETHGWRDFCRRLRRALGTEFYGTAYDLAIALMALLIGQALRNFALWEWREFGGRLNVWLLAAGVVLMTLGTLCVIRVLSDDDSYNRFTLWVMALAVGFATWSVVF